MNDIILKPLNSEKDIYASLKLCADSLFNQSINNEESLIGLSKKYAKYGRCFVVVMDEDVTGFVAFYINDKESLRAFLSIIVVRNCYHGLGLGSLLFDVVLSSCKLSGMKELWLEVDAGNAIAISFYKQRGFKKSECTSSDSILLSKRI